jgi:5-methylcytosine-specific restriction protein B
MNKNKLTFTEPQMIIYGAPGTGKSYLIKKSLESLNVKDNLIIRTTFHSDYNYSDFIGYMKPFSNISEDKIIYKFSPGPFTLALEKSLSSTELVYLVIEELNRGNSPSIFGDIFQLLDRSEATGDSSYPVLNNDIRKYLDDLNNDEINQRLSVFGDSVIFIPKNLKIVTTMNTADQNVFVLDTAFKRRFLMHYIQIEFDLNNMALKNLNSISQTNLFAPTDKNWTDFAQSINKKIDQINQNGHVVSEDKKLGPFFVTESDVSSRQAFCDKVIFYLKNDVFKYDSSFMKESYEQIYNSFVLNNGDIFTILDL